MTGEKFSKDFILVRFDLLNNLQRPEIQTFIRAYGEDHTRLIAGCFKQALKELK